MGRRNIEVGMEAVAYHDDCIKAAKTLVREIGIQPNSQVCCGKVLYIFFLKLLYFQSK